MATVLNNNNIKDYIKLNLYTDNEGVVWIEFDNNYVFEDMILYDSLFAGIEKVAFDGIEFHNVVFTSEDMLLSRDNPLNKYFHFVSDAPIIDCVISDITFNYNPSFLNMNIQEGLAISSCDFTHTGSDEITIIPNSTNFNLFVDSSNFGGLALVTNRRPKNPNKVIHANLENSRFGLFDITGITQANTGTGSDVSVEVSNCTFDATKYSYNFVIYAERISSVSIDNANCFRGVKLSTFFENSCPDLVPTLVTGFSNNLSLSFDFYDYSMDSTKLLDLLVNHNYSNNKFILQHRVDTPINNYKLYNIYAQLIVFKGYSFTNCIFNNIMLDILSFAIGAQVLNCVFNSIDIYKLSLVSSKFSGNDFYHCAIKELGTNSADVDPTDLLSLKRDIPKIKIN